MYRTRAAIVLAICFTSCCVSPRSQELPAMASGDSGSSDTTGMPHLRPRLQFPL